MFELQSLQGSPSKGIALQTKRGSDIENVLGPELTDRDRRLFQRLLTDHPQWELRKAPTGEYNCAGHVWASRRTCIYNESDWKRILADDGYRKTERPKPDDLAIYVDDRNGILHIGRVLELRLGITSESPPIPWVVSKWNWAGEVCHFSHDHPFAVIGDVSTQFWTDRPET